MFAKTGHVVFSKRRVKYMIDETVVRLIMASVRYDLKDYWDSWLLHNFKF